MRIKTDCIEPRFKSLSWLSEKINTQKDHFKVVFFHSVVFPSKSSDFSSASFFVFPNVPSL
jgi:hypothetical protein